MAGWTTPGVPSPTAATYTLPVPQQAKLSVDTELASGQYPQTVAPTVQQFVASPFGTDVSGDSALTYSATMTADCSKTSFFYFTFGAGSTTMTLTNLTPGQRVRFLVTQDSGGSRTITFSGTGLTIKTAGTPLSTTAAYVDLVEIYTPDAATVYYYSVAKNFA